MTFAIVESSSGAASAAAMNPAIVSGVAGSMSIPPTIVPTGCEPELEPGRDAEVAAAAADRPEEVRLRARRRPAGRWPSAVTISAASSESIVRPYLRTR